MKAGSVLVVVGNRYCGIDYQLERIRLSRSGSFRPILTYTTRLVGKDEKLWRKSFDIGSIRTFSFGDLLTYYGEGSDRYYVHMKEVRSTLNVLGSIGLIGMPAEGFERLLSSFFRFAFPMRVIPLTPDDDGEFTKNVMADLQIGLEEAVRLTDRAKQGSSIPPSRYDISSLAVSQVRIRGPKDDQFVHLIEELLTA